jgi:hypothetical protein
MSTILDLMLSATQSAVAPEPPAVRYNVAAIGAGAAPSPTDGRHHPAGGATPFTLFSSMISSA